MLDWMHDKDLWLSIGYGLAFTVTAASLWLLRARAGSERNALQEAPGDSSDGFSDRSDNS